MIRGTLFAPIFRPRPPCLLKAESFPHTYETGIKMAKSRGPKIVYVCQQCGAQQPKWMGKCPDCGEWNSLVEEKGISSHAALSPRGGLFRMREVAPLDYRQIESQDDSRQPSGIEEFDRVLGGGIVP